MNGVRRSALSGALLRSPESSEPTFRGSLPAPLALVGFFPLAEDR